MAPVPSWEPGEAFPLCQRGSDVLPPKRRQLRARSCLGWGLKTAVWGQSKLILMEGKLSDAELCAVRFLL